ncbi:MAG: arginase family protein [Candidatus Heimdallarchaeota archaeon]|nr:arginase family protein [Candidatus Heimdallarchaeota archaeon]
MTKTFVGFYPAKDISKFNEKDSIVLVGIPVEKTKTTPGGSRKAPKEIRKQSLEFSGVSSEFDVSDCKTDFYDVGDIDSIKEKDKLLLLWEKILNNSNKLVVIGGDHSITYDMLNLAPWDDKTAVIWLDAHADLNDEYPPNVFYSHGTVFANLKKDNNLSAEQMLFIGGHAYTQTSVEHAKLKNKEVDFIPVHQLFFDKSKTLEKIQNFVDKFDRIYLSIDLDSLDQAYVPTLATTEPFGLTPQLLMEVIKIILPKVIYVDIVEAKFTRKNRLVLNLAVGLIYNILQNWMN